MAIPLGDLAAFRANDRRGSCLPGHVDPRLVAARYARHEELVEALFGLRGARRDGETEVVDALAATFEVGFEAGPAPCVRERGQSSR
jgi:hypothetical protein